MNKINIDSMKISLPVAFTAKEGYRYLRNSYQSPLKTLEGMVKSDVLIRLKRGLYTFREGRDPLAVAQFIHSPSYLSFETALAIYEMIPERVQQIISVTDNRPLNFRTATGSYIYHRQKRELFAIGMTILFDKPNPLLIANKEKALLDTLSQAQLKAAKLHPKEILDYVTDGLRVDTKVLHSLSINKMRRMAPLYRNHAPHKLVKALENIKKAKQ